MSLETVQWIFHYFEGGWPLALLVFLIMAIAK